MGRRAPKTLGRFCESSLNGSLVRKFSVYVPRTSDDVPPLLDLGESPALLVSLICHEHISPRQTLINTIWSPTTNFSFHRFKYLFLQLQIPYFRVFRILYTLSYVLYHFLTHVILHELYNHEIGFLCNTKLFLDALLLVVHFLSPKYDLCYCFDAPS